MEAVVAIINKASATVQTSVTIASIAMAVAVVDAMIRMKHIVVIDLVKIAEFRTTITSMIFVDQTAVAQVILWVRLPTVINPPTLQ